MQKLVIGSLAAAVVMFIFGFVFFGLLWPMVMGTPYGESPPQVMLQGYLHMVVTAALIGYALMAVGGDERHQMKALIWFAVAAGVFMHLGGPIWNGAPWREALYAFVADTVMFIAGGYVLVRWFLRNAATTAAAPAE